MLVRSKSMSVLTVTKYSTPPSTWGDIVTAYMLESRSYTPSTSKKAASINVSCVVNSTHIQLILKIITFASTNWKICQQWVSLSKSSNSSVSRPSHSRMTGKLSACSLLASRVWKLVSHRKSSRTTTWTLYSRCQFYNCFQQLRCKRVQFKNQWQMTGQCFLKMVSASSSTH
jgi:hypothetical protein